MAELILDRERCMLCSGCLAVCPKQVFTMHDTYLEVNKEECISCGSCVEVCPVGALDLKV